jgi:hypothetical protein
MYVSCRINIRNLDMQRSGLIKTRNKCKVLGKNEIGIDLPETVQAQKRPKVFGQTDSFMH